jgi:hypothetical protein
MIDNILHGKNVIKLRTWRGGTPELSGWAFIREGQGKIYQKHQGEGDTKLRQKLK